MPAILPTSYPAAEYRMRESVWRHGVLTSERNRQVWCDFILQISNEQYCPGSRRNPRTTHGLFFKHNYQFLSLTQMETKPTNALKCTPGMAFGEWKTTTTTQLAKTMIPHGILFLSNFILFVMDSNEKSTIAGLIFCRIFAAIICTILILLKNIFHGFVRNSYIHSLPGTYMYRDCFDIWISNYQKLFWKFI